MFGIAIYVKHHVPYHTIQNTNFKDLNNTGISLNFPSINNIFAFVYSRHFPYNLTPPISQNMHYPIDGYYNAHNRRWNCRCTTHLGSSLHNLISHLGHASNTPTHIGITNARAYIIHFSLPKNLRFTISNTYINDLSSDHLHVFFKIDLVNPSSASAD